MLINYNNNSFIGFLLNYRIHNKFIFKNINFSLRKRGALILQGENGSGKSTLLRLIAGFLYQENHLNTLLWNSKYVSSSWELHQTRLHYLSNENYLNLKLTVYENLLYWGKLYNSTKYLNDILILLKLYKYKDVMTSSLSLGQLKRVNFAKLLLINLTIWILDEPTIGLDINSIKFLEEMIQEHQMDSGIVFMASHVNLKLKNGTSLKL